MGILDQLSSATLDRTSNLELAKQCLKTPVLLHSIAEGLRTGTPETRIDCAQILIAVGEERPDLLGDFVADLLDASRSGIKPVEKLACQGLVIVAPVRPAELFAERDRFFESARSAGSGGLGAFQVLAALCAENPNYRGKLVGPLFRLLTTLDEKELPKWIGAAGAAVQGSSDTLKRLSSIFEPRRAALSEATQKKVDKILQKLERTTQKPKA